jgi:anthranilate 1,2-dioxygenase large subunit
MPADFPPKEHGLERLRVESYRGLVFATFSERTPSLSDYLGPQMREQLDRIFHRQPITYLGCSRQYSKSNRKLYTENVRDPYHASLLHPFFSTFNLVRASTPSEQISDDHGVHHCVMLFHTEDASGGAAYAESKIESFKEGLRLEDLSIFDECPRIQGASERSDPVHLSAARCPVDPEQSGGKTTLAEKIPRASN